MKQYSRKKILKIGAGLVGAWGAGLPGLLLPGTPILYPSPVFAGSESVQFPENHCHSGKGKRGSLLIAYASQFGSTGEMAGMMGKALCETGYDVDVQRIQNVSDLSRYDGYIIGGPIQYDDWMDEATGFVSLHRDTLRKKPVAYFFSCLTLSKKTPEAIQQANGYAKKLVSNIPEVRPVAVQGFAGVLDYNKMSYSGRLLARMVFAYLQVNEGDYRNPSAIKDWAVSLDLNRDQGSSDAG